MEQKRIVLGIFAHPDDGERLCAGWDFAEAFRQHLDEACSADNILAQELGGLVHVNPHY